MADTSYTVLRLVFTTENDKKHAMEFNNPKSDITEQQVSDLMQMIISKNIFTTKNGDLTGIADGGVVTRSFHDLVP